MIHSIISQLNSNQCHRLLSSFIRIEKISINSNTNQFDNILTDVDLNKYSQILLHLLVENETEGALKLKENILSNSDFLINQSKLNTVRRNDFVDVLALIVSILAWLNIKINSNNNDHNLKKPVKISHQASKELIKLLTDRYFDGKKSKFESANIVIELKNKDAGSL